MPFVARLLSCFLVPVQFWKKLRGTRPREPSIGKGSKALPEGPAASYGKTISGPTPGPRTHSAGAIGIVDEGIGSSASARPGPGTQLAPGNNPSTEARHAWHTSDSERPEVDTGTDSESISSEPDPILTAQMAPVAGTDQSMAPQHAPAAYHPHLDSRPTFADLLSRYYLAPLVVYYLDFGDTLSLQKVLPSLSTTYTQHILHDILPETTLMINTKRGGEGPENIRETLKPVIKRIARHDRVLPSDDRIVYEPEQYTNNCGGFRLGEFVPTSMAVRLPGENPVVWALSDDTPKSRGYRNFRKKPSDHEDSRIVRRRYCIFDDLYSERPGEGQPVQFPVKIFYKRSEGDNGSLRLHAVSIPLACLVERLTAEMTKIKRNRKPSKVPLGWS